jgi:hypothetical protein
MFKHSGETEPNPELLDWSENYARADNIDFFTAALVDMAERGRGHGGMMVIGLLGQRDIPGVTLRQAQSTLRWDLRPSLWSHAFLIAEVGENEPASIAIRLLKEVAIYSRAGHFPEPANNAVTGAGLGLYDLAARDANAALIIVEMNDEDVESVRVRATEQPNLDRTRYDLWATLGVWESYVWSRGERPNPLVEGYPIPAASFVEYCYEAIQLDVTPGGSERNSSPEHLWNGAKWWSDMFTRFGHPVSGYYVIRDARCTLLDPNELGAT